MKPKADSFGRREQLIAGLLWYGTWLASAIVADGLAIGLPPHPLLPILGVFSGYALVKSGIALFILLPVARVALMLLIFLRERDYAYIAISALVLAIILAGVVAGL